MLNHFYMYMPLVIVIFSFLPSLRIIFYNLCMLAAISYLKSWLVSNKTNNQVLVNMLFLDKQSSYTRR